MHTTGVVSGLVVALAFGISGCTPAPATQAPETAAATPAPIAADAPLIRLPVSINEVMVAMVDHASEPLWLDAYEPPTTDAGWRDAEHHAYQMAVDGKLIQLAGTGPNDDVWVTDPDWKIMANEMSGAGMDALSAAKAKDVAALNTAGDRLVASCEACHKKFKPDLTSMGVYKSPDYPAPK